VVEKAGEKDVLRGKGDVGFGRNPHNSLGLGTMGKARETPPEKEGKGGESVELQRKKGVDFQM